MKPISVAQRLNVLSLHSNGYSTRKISAKLGIGNSTVAEIVMEYDADKENFKGGHPRKLTSIDQRAVLTMVRTGKAILLWRLPNASILLFPNLSQSKLSGMYSRRMDTRHV